jgi:quinol monooxygenase YgiN
MFYGCSVVELRQYTLHQGTRERLIQLFEEEFIESQEALGIRVIGPFRDLEDPNRFVWLRGFPDMEERSRMLSAFYDGPVWHAHCDAANATMIDSDNVLLLRPTQGAAADPAVANGVVGSFDRDVTGDALGNALVTANIHYVDRSAIENFAQFFEKTMNPALAMAGARVIAAFETEAATNTFSRLPVREGETVFIWLAVFRDASHFEDHVAMLRDSPDWRRHAPQDVLRQFSRKPEVLRLTPTARSQLRS